MRFTTIRLLAGLALLLAALLPTRPLLAQPTVSAPAWQWGRALADGPDTYLSDVALDGAGNAYVIGDFEGTINLENGATLTSHGGDDVLLAKYSPAGALLWARALGGTVDELGLTIVADAAGNTYITGRFFGATTFGGISLTPRPGGDGFRAKVDAQGAVQWARVGAAALALDAAGRLYEAGQFTGSITLGPTTLALAPDASGNPTPGLYLACYDVQGQVQWARTLAQIGTASGAQASWVCVSAAGVYVAGSFRGLLHTGPQILVAQSQDVYALRYDLQGNWLGALRAGGPRVEELYTATTDAAGRLYLGGTFHAATDFGGISLAGAPDTVTSFLVQYNAQGQAQWGEALPNPVILQRLTTDASGRLYGAGYFHGSISWAGRSLTSLGVDDALVFGYTPQGTVQWLQHGGGVHHDYASGLAVDAAGSVRVVGPFGDEFRFGPSQFSGVPDGNPDSFLARLAPAATTTATTSFVGRQPLTLAPNPARSAVRLGGVPAGSRVQLLDALGRVVRETVLGAGADVSVRGLAAGLYAVRATDGRGQLYSGRLLVE